MKQIHLEIAAFVLLVLPAPGFPTEQKPGGKAEDIHTIRAEVNMVSLPVVVTDKQGKRILDLKKEDFSVFENGVQQEIAGFGATDEPLKIALLLDTSGSTENKLAKIQNAAIEFVNQLHPDDEVAVLSFANDVTLQQDFSIDRDKNEYGIKKTRTGEWTVLYEAVWLALEDVLKPVVERKALVLFSDGVDTRSGKASKKETLELALETRATIYCVYYNTEEDLYRKSRSPSLTKFPPIIISTSPANPQDPGDISIEYQMGRDYLAKLAENSGGLMFDGSQDLHYAFVQIAKELASQYSIGYYPGNPKNDGKFRKIEVKVNKPGLAVRTKKGYYSKKENQK
jgi:Ca-activated chloride channel homolog